LARLLLKHDSQRSYFYSWMNSRSIKDEEGIDDDGIVENSANVEDIANTRR